MSDRLPVFPLSTVLFPGLVLPLHIFEERYRTLVRELVAKSEGTPHEFGVVTLGQHLSTWVVHDFTHLNQIVRTMATQYRDAVGPWRAYLSIIRDV